MQLESPQAIFADTALTSEGWQNNVLIRIKGGLIDEVTAGSAAPRGVLHFPLLLPGMGNVHSHAFQRAMAGLTERAGGRKDDNFWSWREVMYDFLGRFTPEDVERIATRLYSELLSHGYTAVGEFHYLHNDINGNHYSNPAEMSDAIVRAAKATGIHLTLLPVMYETADFGGKPAHDGQKRFTHTADAFVRLMELLVKQYGTDIEVTLGIAPHSLRAVTPDSLQRLLDALPALGLSGCPVHIHAAEQMKEVNDCVAWVGVRPVEFLLKTYAVNGQWCLIHATHMTEAETINLARTGAVAGLCPTTEGNLGDGIFPAPDYLAAGGHVGIGSDSNMCVSPFEELRLMEYNQRLHLQKRAVLCLENTPSVGRTLYQKAAQGGAQALGIKAGVIAKGYRADMIAPAMEHFLLEDKHGDAILDTLVFAVNPRITDSFVAGRHIKQRNM